MIQEIITATDVVEHLRHLLFLASLFFFVGYDSHPEVKLKQARKVGGLQIPKKLVLQHLEFDAAIEFATLLFVVVGGQWSAFTIAGGLDPARIDALFGQKILHSLSAFLREVPIV